MHFQNLLHVCFLFDLHKLAFLLMHLLLVFSLFWDDVCSEYLPFWDVRGETARRTSMRPLPPRSTTSEASTVASEMGRKPSSGLPATIGASAPDGIPTRSPSPQPVLLSEQVSGLEQPPSLLPPQELQQPLPVQRPVRAESPVDIDRGAGGKDSLRAGSWERRPPGLLSASFAAEHM